MTIRVGIGGWTYEPWRGVFYPPGHPRKRELEYAASKVTAIEINATFYGRQKPESFRNWAASVPDGFQFSVKASRFATVRKVLADGADSIDNFMGQGFTELGDRLGPILWQFAATKRFDYDDFARFLDLIPDTQDDVPIRHALEPRHESFRDPKFYALTKARNMAIVFADSDDYPCIKEATADFTYARLQRSQCITTGYDDAALNEWADKTRALTNGNRDAYVFFIAGAKIRNPAAAQALIGRF
jgi:uncharacterized protein YecE (DUF72 family)